MNTKIVSKILYNMQNRIIDSSNLGVKADYRSIARHSAYYMVNSMIDKAMYDYYGEYRAAEHPEVKFDGESVVAVIRRERKIYKRRVYHKRMAKKMQKYFYSNQPWFHVEVDLISTTEYTALVFTIKPL